MIVPLLSDSVLETTETFRAILTLPSGGSSGVQLGTNNVSTITITDDDGKKYYGILDKHASSLLYRNVYSYINK